MCVYIIFFFFSGETLFQKREKMSLKTRSWLNCFMERHTGTPTIIVIKMDDNQTRQCGQYLTTSEKHGDKCEPKV